MQSGANSPSFTKTYHESICTCAFAEVPSLPGQGLCTTWALDPSPPLPRGQDFSNWECASESPRGLLRPPLWPKARVSDSGDLRWVSIIYFPNKFPGEVDTAGPRPNLGKLDPKNSYTDLVLLSQIPGPLPPGCFLP